MTMNERLHKQDAVVNIRLGAEVWHTVDDRTDSRPGEKVSTQIHDSHLPMHSDALAIQFPKQDSFEIRPVVVKSLFRHGDGAHPTTIWHWNAGSVEPAVAPRGVLLDASGLDHKIVPARVVAASGPPAEPVGGMSGASSAADGVSCGGTHGKVNKVASVVDAMEQSVHKVLREIFHVSFVSSCFGLIIWNMASLACIVRTPCLNRELREGA